MDCVLHNPVVTPTAMATEFRNKTCGVDGQITSELGPVHDAFGDLAEIEPTVYPGQIRARASHHAAGNSPSTPNASAGAHREWRPPPGTGDSTGARRRVDHRLATVPTAQKTPAAVRCGVRSA